MRNLDCFRHLYGDPSEGGLVDLCTTQGYTRGVGSDFSAILFVILEGPSSSHKAGVVAPDLYALQPEGVRTCVF